MSFCKGQSGPVLIALTLMGALSVTGCGGKRPARVSVPPPPSAPAPSPHVAIQTPPHEPAGSPPVIYTEVGTASWYGPAFHSRPTSNGETYDMNALTAAHRT